MVNYKQFYEDACDLYFKHKHKHQTDDWEQEYFDDMGAKYDNGEHMCLIHIFYSDDDTIGDVVQKTLEDLQGKKLITATCFDDESLDATIAVMLVQRSLL